MAKQTTMISAAYCSRELCALLERKGIEAHHVMAFVKGGSWYRKYTQDVVCRWLRERYLLQVDAEQRAFFQERPKKVYHHWCPLIIRLAGSKVQLNARDTTRFDSDDFFYRQLNPYLDSYEAAREMAIQYCVENLI